MDSLDEIVVRNGRHTSGLKQFLDEYLKQAATTCTNVVYIGILLTG